MKPNMKPTCCACSCAIERGQEARTLDTDDADRRLCRACECDWHSFCATSIVPIWRDECALPKMRGTNGEAISHYTAAPWIATTRTDPEDHWKAKMLKHLERIARPVRVKQGEVLRAAADREYRVNTRRGRRKQLSAIETRLNSEIAKLQKAQTDNAKAWQAFDPVPKGKAYEKEQDERDLADKQHMMVDAKIEADLLERAIRLKRLRVERAEMAKQENSDLLARDVAEVTA